MDCVSKYIETLQQLLNKLPLEDIRQVLAELHRARLEGRQIFIMGNGGSAATASHFANDLNKGACVPGAPRFRAIALTDNVALMSALANDVGYEHIFAEQLVNLAHPGDVVIGISGSGNSPNVLRAMEVARSLPALTIGFTGFSGGRLKDLVDICVLVPSDTMEQIEDVHLMLEHLICSSLRQACLEVAVVSAPEYRPVSRSVDHAFPV